MKKISVTAVLLLGLGLSACSAATPADSSESSRTSEDRGAEVTTPPSTAEAPTSTEEPSPSQEAGAASTEMVDALAASCGLTPEPIGLLRSVIMTTDDGVPYPRLIAMVTDGASVNLGDLACLLENSGSGKVLGDFPEGGPHEEPSRAHVWSVNGGVWTVFGTDGDIISVLSFDFRGAEE